MITRHLAITMLSHVAESKSVSQMMREVNLLLEVNNSDIREYFPEQDIRFSEFLETLQTQREKDLVFVSEFFNKAYSVIFITIQALREKPSANDIEMCKSVIESLKRLNQEHLLFDGMTKETKKKYFSKD